MPKEKEGVFCRECEKPLNLRETKFVLLGTYDGCDNPLDESFFHFHCFQAWYNKKVKEKARNIIGEMQHKAQSLLKGVVRSINGLGGTQVIGSIVEETDLDDETIRILEDKQKKDENGKNKQRKEKKRTKKNNKRKR